MAGDFYSGLLQLLRDNFDFYTTPAPVETKGVHGELEISVMLYKDRLDLLIDGKKVESSKVYLFTKKDSPILKHGLEIAKKTHVVDVFGVSGFLRPRIKICVDGLRIAGDDF